MVAKLIAEVTREVSTASDSLIALALECAYVLTLLYRAGGRARIILDF
jgi:hypothetical protein